MVLLAFLVPWWVVAPFGVLAALALLLVWRQLERGLPRRALVGPESLPGAIAVVAAQTSQASTSPYLVQVRGETWSARSMESLAIGDRALVLEVDGNHLIVCKLPPELDSVW